MSIEKMYEFCIMYRISTQSLIEANKLIDTQSNITLVLLKVFIVSCLVHKLFHFMNIR